MASLDDRLTDMLARTSSLVASVGGRKRIRYAIARRLLNPFARKLGFTVLSDHFYQPIPSDRELLTYANKERPLNSIEWRIDRQLEFALQLLREYRSEFNDEQVVGACGYRYDNRSFGVADAAFLYSMVRDRKPNRVVEVGAGTSSQVIAAALLENYAEVGREADFISIEPYPVDFLRRLNEHSFMRHTLLEKPVQDLELSVFEVLGESDILFVDSSHVFKPGSDVEFEFLQIYPVLRRGVVVHIHDVFFPFDYPLEWNMKHFLFWNEQYFLETFLQFNRKYEVMASISMIRYCDEGVLADNIDAYGEFKGGHSFWMRAIA